QASIRTILEQLALVYGLIVTGTHGVEIVDNTEIRVAYTLPVDILGIKSEGFVTTKIVDDYDNYTKVAVQYYDVDQAQEIRSVIFDRSNIVPMEGVHGENILAYDFPVVMTEEDALSFAERMAYRARA